MKNLSTVLRPIPEDNSYYIDVLLSMTDLPRIIQGAASNQTVYQRMKFHIDKRLRVQRPYIQNNHASEIYVQ